MNFHSVLSTPPAEHSHWMRELTPYKQKLFSPLAACALSSISKKKIEKIDENGEHKYFPLDIYSRHRPVLTIYIYQQALRCLGISVKAAEKHRRKPSFYNLVVGSLNKMDRVKKVALVCFSDVIHKCYRREGIPIVLLMHSTRYYFGERRINFTKRCIVDIFCEFYKSVLQELWNPRIGMNLLGTRHSAEVRDTSGNFFVVRVKDSGKLQMFSPSLKNINMGEYMTGQLVYSFMKERHQFLIRQKLKFPEHVKINKYHNKAAAEYMWIAYRVSAQFYGHDSLKQKIKGLFPQLQPIQLDYIDEQRHIIYWGMTVSKQLRELKTCSGFISKSKLWYLDILKGFRDLIVGLQHFRKRKLLHTQIDSTTVFLARKPSSSSFRFKIGGFDNVIDAKRMKLDLRDITGTGDRWGSLSDNDYLALMHAAAKGDLERWCQIRYSADLASAALLMLQFFVKEEIVRKTTFNPMIKHDINQVLRSASLTVGKDVQIPSRLLDYPAILVALELSRGWTIHSHPLVKLVGECMRSNWQERPSLESVLQRLESMIAEEQLTYI